MQQQQQEQKKISNSESSATKRLGHRKRTFDVYVVVDIAIGVALFLAAWQAVFWLEFYPSFLLPSPLMVFQRLVFLASTGALEAATVVTVERLAAGFSIAVALGIAVGVAMVRFKRFGRAMSSFCVGLQSFPSIAWVPFAILLVGLNDYGIIFVMVIASAFSMMVSTYSGIRNIPPIYVKAGRNMGQSGLSLFKNVMMPASFPALIIGIRQTWSFAWHALIGAEILMATVGLGALLEFGANFARMDQIVGAMVMIFVIGFIVDRLLFSRLEDRVRTKWGLNQISR
jgi:NitT/TauT family transport system permease protein